MQKLCIVINFTANCLNTSNYALTALCCSLLCEKLHFENGATKETEV